MDSSPSRGRVSPSQRPGPVRCTHEETLLRVNTVKCPSCQPVSSTRAGAVWLGSLAPDNHRSPAQAGFDQELVMRVLHRWSHLTSCHPRGLGPCAVFVLLVSQLRLAEFKKQVSDETQLGRDGAEIQGQCDPSAHGLNPGLSRCSVSISLVAARKVRPRYPDFQAGMTTSREHCLFPLSNPQSPCLHESWETGQAHPSGEKLTRKDIPCSGYAAASGRVSPLPGWGAGGSPLLKEWDIKARGLLQPFHCPHRPGAFSVLDPGQPAGRWRAEERA